MNLRTIHLISRGGVSSVDDCNVRESAPLSVCRHSTLVKGVSSSSHFSSPLKQPLFCILVADDEIDLLSEVSGYLRRRGHTVLEATSFKQAVSAYIGNAEKISVVLTDVRMPDGNGIDLARLVVGQSKGKCPCVLMTGHLDYASLGGELMSAGVRILDKPFGMSALHTVVLGAIRTGDRNSEHASKGPDPTSDRD